MDSNEFHHRHQISIVRAAGALSREAPASHRLLASGFAARIADVQHDSGVKRALAPLPA